MDNHKVSTKIDTPMEKSLRLQIHQPIYKHQSKTHPNHPNQTRTFFLIQNKVSLFIWFNGISTFDSYLMPNPVYTCDIFK